ncbi:MAG: hypothetical protein GY816_04330 [Cytophagales bacterium]|nr:hypothetical protein [Cytophagales bacterium]
MKTYQNLSGKSAITSYEIGQQRMVVEYKNGSAYLYDDSISGGLYLDIMKDLTQTGLGLHTFITQFVGTNNCSRLD